MGRPRKLNEYRIEGSVVWIKLTQGKETCVDLADWPLVREYTWFAYRDRGCGECFYATGRVGGRTVRLHRLLAGQDGLEVDHKDGNGLNNLRSNLRVATHAQNMYNRRAPKTNVSGFKGIRLQGRRWVARVGSGGGKPRYIGSFSSSQEAALAYDQAAKQAFGDFARLNFPVQSFVQ